ncbi:MAG: NTP transferase domain-containing protein [Nitrososphaerota archaeon]|jgi:bifunctional UDP-N-acetylglucosamine pyrophosphorylase/glucosamine-1-phosphate N-acetyltransferase|nr:NTP transferase domain-containing protein [Nitrososphaerota archaeon]
MKAILLAAGEGQRLQPLTSTRPKHLITLTGKPILQFCLDAIKTAGITDIVIITHYMSDKIKTYFGDGTSQGLKIAYVEQKELLGTGNAAMAAELFVDDDPFVLVYGDLLFAQDTIKQVVDSYSKAKPAAVMAVVSVDKPENYGIIDLAEGKKLKRIIEKPVAKETSSNLVNAGIYVFSKEIFKKLCDIKKSIRGELELTDALTMLASEGKTVLIEELDRTAWFDVGKPWDLLDANIWALNHMEPQVLGTIEPKAHIFGPVYVAKSARVRSGAYIEGPVFIDEEADVGPNCYIRSGTSLGKKTRIGNAVEIKNSLIMDKARIGHLSYVGDSVIGEKCNFGAGTITANLRFDDDTIKMIVKNRLMDTGKRKLGVVLGDNVKTGIKASFMPGVKVGTNTWIGANFMVTHDLPSNSIALLKQQENIQPRKNNLDLNDVH